MSDPIREIINNAIRKYFEEHKKEFDDRITVTEAIYCLRRSWFRRKNPDLEFQPSVYTFIGHAVHEALLNHIDGKSEVEFEFGDVVGHADAVVEIDGEPTILELKVVGEIPRKPDYEYALQLNAYLCMSGINQGYLVYFNRTNGDVRSFKITPNKHLFRYVMQRAYQLRKALEKDELPQEDNDFVAKYCFFCPYRDVCKPNDDNSNSKQSKLF